MIDIIEIIQCFLKKINKKKDIACSCLILDVPYMFLTHFKMNYKFYGYECESLHLIQCILGQICKENERLTGNEVKGIEERSFTH